MIFRNLPLFFAALLAVAPLPGCASALKDPPALEALGGGGPVPTREGVDPLLVRGDVLYASRTLEDVRQAAAVWLEAARGDPGRVEGLIGAARALVWLTDHEADPAARESAAGVAVQAAQWCLRIAPEKPACSYWLGAALGVKARERPVTGIDALPQIEIAFRKSAALDPEFEEGSPDRALALLYLRAPGWPTGPGDPNRGLEHARKATAIAPDFPPNLLALAEALSATGDPEGSREACGRAIEAARKRQAAGDPDAWEWIREANDALSVHRR